MNVLVVYTHPHPYGFNQGILERIEKTLVDQKQELRTKKLYELYEQGFNPVLDYSELSILKQGKIPGDIQKEHKDILWAEALVFVYPIWWYSCPALLKGWIDRVFCYDFAYRMGVKGLEGLLHHEKALVITTSANSHEDYENSGGVELIERPMTIGTLAFCGIKKVHYKALYSVQKVSDRERSVMLDEVGDFTRESFL